MAMPYDETINSLKGAAIRYTEAKAQETIAKTLTPNYLRFKLYDSQNSKVVLLPDQLHVPILINPGPDQPRQRIAGESEER